VTKYKGQTTREVAYGRKGGSFHYIRRAIGIKKTLGNQGVLWLGRKELEAQSTKSNKSDDFVISKHTYGRGAHYVKTPGRNIRKNHFPAL